MKKIISVILILVVIMSLTSCRNASDDLSSSVSNIDDMKISMPQNSTETETQLPPQNEEKVYQSTIDTPKEVIFYKGGKCEVSTDKKLNLDIARCVEAWYKNYENDTLPLTKTAVTDEMIAELKYSETVIEICFDYDQEINILGKIKLDNTTRLLIPLTGNQAYYVFRGNGAYKYQNGMHAVKGKGLEKYFEGVTLDKNVNNWESTVAAPATVTFYKDGMQSVSTDKELNHKIARHIEAWYKYQTTFASCNCITYDHNIIERKHTETAIELIFDNEIKFYGGNMQSDERKIFISLDGKRAYEIFSNDLYFESWRDCMLLSECGGLEQFFEGRKFEEIPNNEWESTVVPPARVQLYKNGELLEELTDLETNQKIAQHIESWYIYKDSIESSNAGMTADTIGNVRRNETYVEIFFHSEIKFYGKNMLQSETYCLLIPLTGDYAYCVFEAASDCNYNRFNFPEKGNGLEQFFESLTVDNNE